MALIKPTQSLAVVLVQLCMMTLRAIINPALQSLWRKFSASRSVESTTKKATCAQDNSTPQLRLPLPEAFTSTCPTRLESMRFNSHLRRLRASQAQTISSLRSLCRLLTKPQPMTLKESLLLSLLRLLLSLLERERCATDSTLPARLIYRSKKVSESTSTPRSQDQQLGACEQSFGSTDHAWAEQTLPQSPEEEIPARRVQEADKNATTDLQSTAKGIQEQITKTIGSENGVGPATADGRESGNTLPAGYTSTRARPF